MSNKYLLKKYLQYLDTVIDIIEPSVLNILQKDLYCSFIKRNGDKCQYKAKNDGICKMHYNMYNRLCDIEILIRK